MIKKLHLNYMHATAIYFYIFSSLLCHFLFIFHSYIGKLLFTAGLNKRFAAVAIFIIKLVIFNEIKTKREGDKNEISDFYDFIKCLNGDKKCEFDDGKKTRNKNFNKLCADYAQFLLQIRNLMFNPIDRLTSNDEILPFDGRKFLDPRELIRISIKKISNDDEVKFYKHIIVKIYSQILYMLPTVKRH